MKIIIQVYKKYVISIFLNRFIGPILTLLMLHFNPKLIGNFVNFLLVFLKYRIEIPMTKELIKKTDSVLDDFNIEASCPDFEHTDEINIVMRGDSLDVYWDEIDCSIPTYYVNMYGSFFEKYYDRVTLDNAVYITGDINVYKSMLKNELFPVYFVRSSNNSIRRDIDTNHDVDISIINKYGSSISGGSGVACVLLLCSLADKINIYGWDGYFKSPVYNMSYYVCIWNIYLLAKHGLSPNKIKKEYYSDRFTFVLSKMSSLHYAARILELDNKDICIRSFLSGVLNQRRLLDKLSKVFYKS
jgi:hypothetical protein